MTDASEQILKRRAEVLAVTDGLTQVVVTELVVFRVGGQLAAFRASEVEGAGRVRELAPVPGGPAWLTGVVQSRGRVLSLVDLNRVWSAPRRGVADQTSYVVVASGPLRLGVLSEELLGFQEIETTLVPFEGTDRPGVIEVARLGADHVLVLTARRVFQALGLGDAP